MIKRTQVAGTETLITYICDLCVKEMPGAAIQVYFPYSHCNDSIDGPSHFCSDACLVKFEVKMRAKYGDWRSKPLDENEKVRSSADYRKATQKKVELPPKARRAIPRKTLGKNKKPKQNDQAPT